MSTTALTISKTYPCTRCGGTGRYSFNLMHGTKCYGCGGTGQHRTKPRKPTPKWAVFGHDRNTMECVRLYNVTAKSEQAAIEKARNTMAGASAAFKDTYTLAQARAIRFDQMIDQAATTWEAAVDPVTQHYTDRNQSGLAALAS